MKRFVFVLTPEQHAALVRAAHRLNVSMGTLTRQALAEKLAPFRLASDPPDAPRGPVEPEGVE
jgi:hypothetical protein